MFNKNNEPIIIKNTDFKKCMLFISFPINEYKEEYLKILDDIIFDRSMKYNTKRKIAVANINNYCLSYDGKISFIGNNAFLEFTLSYPCYDSLKKDVLEDNLMFAKEMIFNPYLEDGIFPESKVEETIKLYKEKVKRKLKNYDGYYNYKNELLIDEDNYIISPVFKDLSLLDNINGKNLYDFYKNIISNPPLVFLIGNVDEIKSKKLIKEILLDNKVSNIKFKKDYFIYVKDIPDEVLVVREKTNFSTTGVYCNYKVRNMNNYKDTVLLSIVKELLSSSNSNILFNYLRKDNDLVYRTGAYNYDFGTLTLVSFTGNSNVDKVFEIYDKAMKNISDINYIDSKLPLFVEKARVDSELDKEYLGSILFSYVDKYLEYLDKKYYDVIKDITASEVKDFVDNRLVLVSKYIGVGDDNE